MIRVAYLFLYLIFQAMFDDTGGNFPSISLWDLSSLNPMSHHPNEALYVVYHKVAWGVPNLSPFVPGVLQPTELHWNKVPWNSHLTLKS